MADSAASISVGIAPTESSDHQFKSRDAHLFYKTLVSCTDKLVKAFAGSCLSIADRLVSNDLLHRDVYEELVLSGTPEKNARKMVISVCRHVQLNAEKYTEFVQLLQTDVYLIDTNIVKSLHDSYLSILSKNQKALKADKAPLRISSEKPCITVLDSTTPEVVQRNTDDDHRQAVVTAEYTKNGLIDDFIEIVATMESILTESTITVDRFRRGFIHKLSVFEKQRHVHFLENKVNVISDAKSFHALFSIFDLYWDYLNYHLLACLVRDYGNGDARCQMNEYSKRVISFMENTTLKVFWEIQPCLKSVPPPEFSQVEMRYEMGISSTSTLIDVENIRLRMKKDIGLNEYALLLSRIKGGSLIILWFTTVAFHHDIESALKSELSVIERPSLQNQVIDHNSTIEKPTGLDQVILQNVERMRANFGTLMLNVQLALEAKQVAITNVHDLLIKKGKFELPEFKQFSDMFSHITKLKLWSYDNHGPLEMIISEILNNDPDIQDQVEGYKGDLTSFFVATKLVNFIDYLSKEEKEVISSQSKQHTELQVFLDLSTEVISDYSLDFCYKLWEMLARECILPTTTAAIKRISCEDRVEITWLVPRKLVEKLVVSSRFAKLVAFYRQNQIFLLVANGTTIFSEEEMRGYEQDLLRLCSRDDSGVDDVSKVLSHGVNPNAMDAHGYTPLMKASDVGNSPLVELLIKNGADVHHRDMNGDTALHITASATVAEVLIDNGANIDELTKDTSFCRTPLFIASSAGRMELVELLVHKGANVNKQNMLGCAPLHIASELGHTAIVEHLTDNGALLDLPVELPHLVESNVDISELIRTAFTSPAARQFEIEHASQFAGNNEAILFQGILQAISHYFSALENSMLSQVPIHILFGCCLGNTALMLACQAGQISVVQVLLLKGANVNIQNKIGFSPLHCAVQTDAAIVKLLIDYGANTRIQDVFLNTPLHLAQTADHAELLLDHGAKIDSLSMDSCLRHTPLLVACTTGKTDLVKLLVHRGANVNLPNLVGLAPLHVASTLGNASIVEILIDNSAKIDLPYQLPLLDESGINVSALLKKTLSSPDVRILEPLANEKDPLFQAKLMEIFSHNCQILNSDLLSQANVPAKVLLTSLMGNSALMLACAEGQIHVVQNLLFKGANVNFQNEIGTSPLHNAAGSDNAAIVNLLISNGANVQIQDVFFNTPLHIASNAEVAELLLSHGAKVDSKNEDGNTPLFLAALLNRAEVVCTLIKYGATIDVPNEPLYGKAAEFEKVNKAIKHAENRLSHKQMKKILTSLSQPMEFAEQFVQMFLIYEEAISDEVIEWESFFNGIVSCGNTPLMGAAIKGHAAIVQLLIREKADVNHQNKFGLTPLHVACNAAVAELLIENGAKIELTSKEETGSVTALFQACIRGKIEVAEVLIRKGAFVHTQNRYCLAPLHVVSETGNSEICKLLLDNGAQVDIKGNITEEGCTISTPLTIACKSGNTVIVKMLISRGANVSYQCEYCGFTPLHAASVGGYADIVNFLIDKGAQVNLPLKDNYDCSTALILASYNNHVTVVELLINKKAIVNYQNKLGIAPLHAASQVGHTGVVEVLLNNGAIIDIPIKEEYGGDTALILACDSGHANVAKLLIKRGADVDKQNEHGYTSLHTACHKGHIHVAEVLANSGAQIDIQTKEEDNCNSALILASSSGYTDIVKLLILKNANVNFQNKLGETPLHSASRSGHSEVAEALIDGGATLDIPTRDEYDGNSPLILACANKHIALTEILICKKANVNYQNKDGRTALFFAVWEGEVQICRLLIENKANVNIQDKDGLTCLMLATQKEHSPIVKELLINSADPNITEMTTNWSALFFAAKNGNIEIVHMLLNGGSRKDMRDMANMTAYDIAKIHGHQNVCDVLQLTYQEESSESMVQELEQQESQDTVEMSTTYKPLMKIFANIENKLLKERARKKEHMLAKSKPTKHEDMFERLQEEQYIEMNRPQTHAFANLMELLQSIFTK